jgi:uncharacterized protein
MKPIFIVAGIVLAAVLALAAKSTDSAVKHRIVFELTSAEPETWNGLLNNVENVRSALGEDRTNVEVVVHGKGLGFLKPGDGKQGERMKQLADAGVVFAACENTMRRQNVVKADLLPFVTIVDSGVAEIVRKQEAGWSYLRIGG